LRHCDIYEKLKRLMKKNIDSVNRLTQIIFQKENQNIQWGMAFQQTVLEEMDIHIKGWFLLYNIQNLIW
jgi:hypothetical protein